MKHRDNIYLVERRAEEYTVVCAAYSTQEAAQDAADAFMQQWIDKGLGNEVSFHVILTTYYEV